VADHPTSPFSGLDKALLRSTRPDTPPPPEAVRTEIPPSQSTEKSVRTKPTRHRSDQTSKPATERTIDASELASSLADNNDLIQAVRKTLKAQGKEVAFTRITPEEKGRLADILYTYKRHGRKTTENEITRIAINYLLEDYMAHGDLSILASILAALDA